MNLAPGPQEQVNIVRWQLGCIERPESAAKWGASPTLKSLAIFYNAFADVPAFGLPHIDRFANMAAAKAALEGCWRGSSNSTETRLREATGVARKGGAFS
jgi:hypothetical protein